MGEYETPFMNDVDHMLGKVACFSLLGALGASIGRAASRRRQEEEDRRQQADHLKDVEKFYRFALKDFAQDFVDLCNDESTDVKLLSKVYAETWNLDHRDLLVLDYRNGLKYNIDISFRKWKLFC